jgi:NADPH:quinone reductase-like Zn-dependent oxidoreductase
MRAVVIEEHGGRDKLKLTDFPDPAPGAGDVLVRVRACGLNHLDLLVREGRVPVPVPMPHILGCEVAGHVAALGDGLTDDRLYVGQPVAVLTRISCGRCEYCRAQQDNLCLESRAVGLATHGGYAEYVRVPARNVIPLPEAVSCEDAAASVMSMLTAWHMLLTRAQLRSGETLLVIAAGSGIGSAAIQIGRMVGARVIATAASDDKLERAWGLGADEAVNTTRSDLVAEVRRLTDKRGVDVVFEHVGAATFSRSVDCMARNGRLVTCGAHTGREVTLDLWTLFAKQLQLVGSYLGTRGELRELLQVMATGRLRPVIDRRFTLDQAAEAHRVLEERQQFGKLLLVLD